MRVQPLSERKVIEIYSTGKAIEDYDYENNSTWHFYVDPRFTSNLKLSQLVDFVGRTYRDFTIAYWDSGIRSAEKYYWVMAAVACVGQFRYVRHEVKIVKLDGVPYLMQEYIFDNNSKYTFVRPKLVMSHLEPILVSDMYRYRALYIDTRDAFSEGNWIDNEDAQSCEYEFNLDIPGATYHIKSRHWYEIQATHEAFIFSKWKELRDDIKWEPTYREGKLFAVDLEMVITNLFTYWCSYLKYKFSSKIPRFTIDRDEEPAPIEHLEE